VAKENSKENSTPASAEKPTDAGRALSSKRKLVGVIVGDKMDKTRVVVVERRLAHKKYGKYMTRRAKYKAHDEKNEYRVGDRVEIVESRPLSREKRWRVERLLDRPQEA
jgi:small subunit ribosomal protein S17